MNTDAQREKLLASTTPVTVGMLTQALDVVTAAVRERDERTAARIDELLQLLAKQYARATSTDELLVDVERRVAAIEKSNAR